MIKFRKFEVNTVDIADIKNRDQLLDKFKIPKLNFMFVSYLNDTDIKNQNFIWKTFYARRRLNSNSYICIGLVRDKLLALNVKSGEVVLAKY